MLLEAQLNTTNADSQRRLIETLRDPACYAHAAPQIRVIETHISYVVLTGTFAYKIKKRVDLGFVDFMSLEKRRFFCDEELRLNSRLAPALYLAVVPIGGTFDQPRVGSGGKVLEYAVQMREFPQDAMADRTLARGELNPRQIDALAAQIAGFHCRVPRSGEQDEFGAPAAIGERSAQNFAQIRAIATDDACLQFLDEIEVWSGKEQKRLLEQFLKRKREGYVRECHGDLHLGNILILDGSPLVFDCIEFNPDFRWIDVMDEVAFVVMDLQAAHRPDFAARFLNAYLESTGDYGGLQVLRYYLIYRAVVRAKIHLMRARQVEAGSREAAALLQKYHRYLVVARNCMHDAHRFVVITHGFSGCGKTTLSESLLELSGAIRIRSDVERKRIHGHVGREEPAALLRSTPITSGIYAADATERTYRRLLDLARQILEGEHGVIVDATFLKIGQRELLRNLAEQTGAAFAIVDFNVDARFLRERIMARLRHGNDASDADLAVLAHQMLAHDPLQDEELPFVFSYDASRPLADAQRLQSWTPLLRRLSLLFY